MEHKKHEVMGLCLLVMTLLVLLSLLSFDRSDLTIFNASTVNRAPHNWIGSFGANLAWGLIFFAGLGAYWLPITTLWATWAFLRGHRPFFYDGWQALGTLLLMVSSITLISLYAPRIYVFKQEISSGGQLGLVLASLLRRQFDTVGTYILTLGILLTGLLLATPFSLQATARWLGNSWNRLCRGTGALFSDEPSEPDASTTAPPTREPATRSPRSNSSGRQGIDTPLIITAPPIGQGSRRHPHHPRRYCKDR